MSYHHPIDIIPENDHERLKALEKYRIFDTPDEPGFKQICALAAKIFNVPIVHISFMGKNEEFVKEDVGIGGGIKLVDRGTSLCALAILNSEVTVIEDASLDSRLKGHPYVDGEFHLRFYAGAPIISPDKYVIGTMCLVDRKPGKLSKYEQSILQGLANVVMEQLELRLNNLEQRERIEEINVKLRHNEDYLKGIIDTMAEGVAIVDVNGKPIYTNPMAQKIFGVSEISMRERAYNDNKWINLKLDGSVLPSDEHPTIMMLKNQKAIYDQEIGVRKADGQLVYITINAAPLFDFKGTLSGGVCTFTDATTRRKILNEKDDFISIASHELKTPLTTLQATIQVLNKLKNSLDSPIVPALISHADKSLLKLNRLVDDLLNISRIDSGMLKLQKTKFLLSDLIYDCSTHISLEGNYEIILSGDTSVEIEADWERIEQVVINMVNNAIKYAPDSKIINVEIKKLDASVRVSVKDEGPGIEAETLPHIFDKYYRADHNSLKFSGLGLGLYISADIVRKHNGEIGVESAEGKGSEFWFTLPVTKIN